MSPGNGTHTLPCHTFGCQCYSSRYIILRAVRISPSLSLTDTPHRQHLYDQGEADTLVPPRHMQQLHDLASGSRDRKLVTIPFGTHDDTWVRGGTDYLDAFAAFLAKHRCAGTKSAKSSSRSSGRSAPLHRSEL